VLFEVTSAFATVGLSTGITAQLGTAGHVILILLMFVGRLGPITAAAALALRERTRRYELPEERPIVG
jgi:Trk-type K+ transport system membrane component